MNIPTTDIRLILARLPKTSIVKQKTVFRDLFYEAKSDIIFKIWIARVGLDGILDEEQRALTAMHVLNQGMASLAVNTSVVPKIDQTASSLSPAQPKAWPVFTGNNDKRTRKLFAKAMRIPSLNPG